jgi:hypothetical protein
MVEAEATLVVTAVVYVPALIGAVYGSYTVTGVAQVVQAGVPVKVVALVTLAVMEVVYVPGVKGEALEDELEGS